MVDLTYTCGGSGTCTTYDSCDLNLDFLDDGSKSIYEKLCIMIELFKQAIGDVDGIDEELAKKEDKTNLTNVRLLSETGDFTGTWVGETKAQYTAFIQALIDALQVQIDALEVEDARIESKFDGEVVRIDGELTLKENSVDITNNRKLDDLGDFTGTLDGNTIASLLQAITDANALSQQAIDLVNANPQLNVVFVDGGFYLDGLTPTVEDFGLYTDPDTESEDYGLYIYPCECSII